MRGNWKNKNRLRQRGSILAVVLVMGSFFLVVFTGLLGFVGSQRHLSVKKMQREEAFNIAEAGVEMYLWHIEKSLNGKTATQVEEYWEGEPLGVPEYEREHLNPEGEAIGKFKLEVTPPEDGSTIIEIKSTGWNYNNPLAKRVIIARLRKPSWSEYVILANNAISIEEGAEVWGAVHSNEGIHFDGIAHNLVSASKEVYWDVDTGSTQEGVWTSRVDPEAVFLGGKDYPVGSVDFTGIIGDLVQIRTAAQEEGIYLEADQIYPDGYHLILKDNGTVDIYGVTLRGEESHHANWETFLENRALPASGAVFVEGDVTVEGKISNQKLTIVAADLDGGSGNKNIYIEHDITYAHHNGDELLGLIAQGDIKIGLFSEDNLRIDAALAAQNGSVSRDYYSVFDGGSHFKKEAIIIYGAIATNLRYRFSWSCEGEDYCSGYADEDLIFDSALLHEAPPYFPTGELYKLDNWEELK